MSKPALRAAARARRDAFVAAGPLPLAVDPRFVAGLASGAVVASYLPIGSEADPAPLENAARAAGCRIALPHAVDRATPLRFLLRGEDEGDDALVDGPFGLRNPPAHWPEVAPDVILAPLLAFDGQLARLGQGAGHYDRAFAGLPAAWRVGVGWSVQRVEALMPDPWDVPLHAVATEERWWTR